LGTVGLLRQRCRLHADEVFSLPHQRFSMPQELRWGAM
jgi:hypothetical protein